MITAVKKHDRNNGNGFPKANSSGIPKTIKTGQGTRSATGKQLKQLCLDVLNREGLGGIPLIERVIETVARDDPSKLLPFAGKLIPQESEVVTTKVSPIVLGADITPSGVLASNGVVVEQSVVTTNADVIEVEPVVIDVVEIKKKRNEVCSIGIDDDL